MVRDYHVGDLNVAGRTSRLALQLPGLGWKGAPGAWTAEGLAPWEIVRKSAQDPQALIVQDDSVGGGQRLAVDPDVAGCGFVLP